MNTGQQAAQQALLAKHGPIAERAAAKYSFTPAQKKLFVEMATGYISTHFGAEPPNGYDQLAAMAKRNAK